MAGAAACALPLSSAVAEDPLGVAAMSSPPLPAVVAEDPLGVAAMSSPPLPAVVAPAPVDVAAASATAADTAADIAGGSSISYEDVTSISYQEVTKLLIQCKEELTCPVGSVAFTSASGETADVMLASGKRLGITGIPVENPNNDSSPYKLVAKLRDAKVPYTFPFSSTLAKYRKQ